MRGRPRIDEWPKEFHGPGGERAFFNEQMYVPLNWTPYPQINPPIENKVPKTFPDREVLKAALIEKGIKVDPRWSVAKMDQMLKE
jgi:hypothetical protein